MKFLKLKYFLNLEFLVQKLNIYSKNYYFDFRTFLDYQIQIISSFYQKNFILILRNSVLRICIIKRLSDNPENYQCFFNFLGLEKLWYYIQGFKYYFLKKARTMWTCLFKKAFRF